MILSRVALLLLFLTRWLFFGRMRGNDNRRDAIDQAPNSLLETRWVTNIQAVQVCLMQN